MSSARSRKFRNEFYDRLDRAKVAKNPRLVEERLEEANRRAEMQPMTPLRTSGAIGSWKGFANEQEKNEHMQGMMRFFNELPIQQDVLREQRERREEQRRFIINGVEHRIVGVNNFNLGGGVWQVDAPHRERNEAPQWEVNFTRDPTVRFENLDVPVAPKEPDICDIINLDD